MSTRIRDSRVSSAMSGGQRRRSTMATLQDRLSHMNPASYGIGLDLGADISGGESSSKFGFGTRNRGASSVEMNATDMRESREGREAEDEADIESERSSQQSEGYVSSNGSNDGYEEDFDVDVVRMGVETLLHRFYRLASDFAVPLPNSWCLFLSVSLISCSLQL